MDRLVVVVGEQAVAVYPPVANLKTFLGLPVAVLTKCLHCDCRSFDKAGGAVAFDGVGDEALVYDYSEAHSVRMTNVSKLMPFHSRLQCSSLHIPDYFVLSRDNSGITKALKTAYIAKMLSVG